jgi:hypothetical protein
MMLFFGRDEPAASSHLKKSLTYAENRPVRVENLVVSCKSPVRSAVREPQASNRTVVVRRVAY